MQFVIIGLDGDDPEAAQRRIAVRPAHIEMGDRLLSDGHLWFGAALVRSDGSMRGSMYLLDFPDREQLDQWMATEPYIVGDVWRTVEVYDANVRDPWQFSQQKAFYEGRTDRRS